jgi:WD40 repeat protein
MVNHLSGGRLAESGGAPLKLWRVSDGALMQTLVGESNDVWSVDTSPDGKLIASASEDGSKIRIWRFLTEP